MRPFEEWDQLTMPAQTWIALQTIIQESFQRQLNATAPTASSHSYAQAQPLRQNAFGALEANNTDKESVNGFVATQVAALTYQSQLTTNTAANTSMHQEQQLVHLMTQQHMMHKNMHQLIAGLNAVTFDQSDEGRGAGRFAPRGFSVGYRGCACGRGDRSYHGRGCGHQCLDIPPWVVSHPQLEAHLISEACLVFPNTSLLQQGCKHIAPLRENHTVLQCQSLQHLFQTRLNVSPLGIFVIPANLM
jgi:hypothetical protein